MLGSTILHYRILSRIGGGGMGVVYEAEDLKLGRRVALKFLPAELEQHPEALERFKREARAASALNHPNICVVHAIEQHEGRHFIAMELVQGSSLSTKISGKPLPPADLLDFAIQIADALDAAHTSGIVHRDIKPANIVVGPRGQIKILDFGLAKFGAKAVAAAEPTVGVTEEFLTTPGSAMGTVAYMSPEQARAEEVDARSDLFSLGAVLYEMATGRVPHAGASSALIFDGILNRVPDAPSRINPAVPPDLDRVILKLLDKDRDLRYQTAAELRTDLKRARRDSGSASGLRLEPASALPPRSKKLPLLAGAAVIVIALALLGNWLLRRAPTGPPRLEFTQLTNFTDAAVAPAISRDGRMLAFIRGEGIPPGASAPRGDLYLKPLPNGEPIRLTHQRDLKSTPAFSPDGSRVAYTVLGPRFAWDTWEVPVLGSSPPRLMLANATGLNWLSESQLLFSEIKSGIHMALVTASRDRTNQRDVYVPPVASGMVHRSFPSPDGRWALVVEMDGAGWLPCRLLPLDGSSVGRQVGPADAQCTSAAWSPDGEWMYFSSESGGAYHLWRQRFAGGAPEQLTSGATEEEGVVAAPDGKSLITSVGTRRGIVSLHERGSVKEISSQGYAILPSFSPDEKYAYFLIRAGASRSYVSGELWRTELASGREEPVLPGIIISHYRLSPDGRRVLYAITGPSAGIWLADLDRSTPPRQLTKEGEYRAFFGAPGEVIFQAASEPRLVYRMKEDGTGREQALPDPVLHVFDVSPGGEWLIASQPASGGARASDVVAYPLQQQKRPVVLCDVCIAGAGPGRVRAPLAAWSPDGRYLYVSLQYFGGMERSTVVVPVKPGAAPPVLSIGRLHTAEEIAARMPGSRILNEANVFPGLDPSRYLAARVQVQANLYRLRFVD